jgi:hypothetical protein
MQKIKTCFEQIEQCNVDRNTSILLLSLEENELFSTLRTIVGMAGKT